MKPIAGRVPERRTGLLPRSRLTDRLQAERNTPVIALVAGAGYGKTTLLGEWVGTETRPVTWLSLRPADDGPVAFLTRVVEALHAIEPIPAPQVAGLTVSAADLTSVRLPRLRQMLNRRTKEFVLVIDDAHVLASDGALAVLETLCDTVPPGSQLLIGSRHGPRVPMGAMRARGVACVFDAHDLAMTNEEGAALLERAGLALDAATSDLLMKRTEGWPAALYLATVALREQPDPGQAALSFAGDARVVVDYLRDELFAALPEATVEFLVSTSILEVLTGLACDALLDTTGSAELLEQLVRSNLLVIPLDRSRAEFRYHSLLRDELRSRLHRRAPDVEARLHGRASEWCEVNGMLDEAVSHAQQAGVPERFDALVWRAAPAFLGSGRTARVESWIAPLAPEEIAARPAIAVTAAWCALTSGDMRRLTHWVSIIDRVTPEVPLPDGTPLAAAASLLRALVGARGLAQLEKDAAAAYALDRRGSPFRAVACLLEGSALRLQGELARARPRLEEGAETGRLLVPASWSQCVAQLGVLAVDEGNWEEAERLVDEALAVVDQFGLHERPAQADVFAAAALVHAHEARTADARRELEHSIWLLSMLATVGPWIAAEARILLGRAALLLGDVGMARMLAKEAEGFVGSMPDAGLLPERLDRLTTATDADSTPIGVTATPLTPAEMRVLRYLPTHLTFGAIANELFVSRNTVKTQAISIYRKLGVTSRTPAVDRARDLGLIDD